MRISRYRDVFSAGTAPVGKNTKALRRKHKRRVVASYFLCAEDFIEFDGEAGQERGGEGVGEFQIGDGAVGIFLKSVNLH